MILFITMLAISIFVFIASIILGFKTYKKNKKIASIDSYKRKNENRLMLMSLIGLIFSVFVMVYSLFNAIPSPTIYPLDNEAKVYDGVAEVYIDSYPLLKTYYTLDGSNPEFGNVYDGTFIVSKTTTVSAKNKFLVFWSGLSQNTFRFESAQNITVDTVNNNIGDHTTIKDFFTYLIISFIFGTILVLAIRGELNK